jgi:outer membrane beta-barrel protein
MASAAVATLAAMMTAQAAGAADAKAPPADGKDDPAVGADACVDENVKADLFAKRRMRGARDRLFLQTNRLELTVRGGYYVSDLLDGTYVAGGAYAYHMTEDLALEASGAYTRLASAAGSELERTFVLLQNKSRRALLFDADLIWTPAHGKMRVGGSIVHFDPFLAAGGGVVDSVLASDIAGNAGFGLRFFIGRAVAIRLDVRDHIYRQQLLARKVLVNDLTSMLGVSLYLPLGE